MIASAALFLSVMAASATEFFALYKLPPPPEYGNLLISRVTNSSMPPVAFSHWRHRIEYTCRVCHIELEFGMKANTTEINCAEDMSERYCRSCHDGKTAFDQGTECTRCHNGDVSSGSKKFRALISGVPSSRYGNRIDWSRALKRKRIRPRRSLFGEGDYKPLTFKKTLNLEAEWPYIPAAVFPHGAHILWLDCENCHPDTFVIKKKRTIHFEMKGILEGKFCGVCHLSVAFPVHDCKKCHPAIKE